MVSRRLKASRPNSTRGPSLRHVAASGTLQRFGSSWPEPQVPSALRRAVVFAFDLGSDPFALALDHDLLLKLGDAANIHAEIEDLYATPLRSNAPTISTTWATDRGNRCSLVTTKVSRFSHVFECSGQSRPIRNRRNLLAKHLLVTERL
jgi:hypothetical protein